MLCAVGVTERSVTISDKIMLALVLSSLPALELPVLATRRAALHAAVAAAAASSFPATLTRPAFAADELATAIFSGGDPRFMQPAFDEIRYLGLKSSEVGTIGGVPAIKVAYDAGKLSYKRLVGTFWRSCDPTSKDSQFGDPGPTIIWTGNDEEKAIAEESRRRLQLATEYKSSTFGPMYKGRPIQTEIRPLSGEWAAAPEADQAWYKAQPDKYAKARQKTGRTKWFEEAFKPVTVTACQRDESGSVCGYVYFPCSEENGCSAVTKGTF